MAKTKRISNALIGMPKTNAKTCINDLLLLFRIFQYIINISLTVCLSKWY